MKRVVRLLLCLLVLIAVLPAHAHVGSKDVFQTVQAGPYTLFVTIRVPNVIPGVASVEVRGSSESGAKIDGIEITPTPLTGEASKHPPTADTMTRSKDDPGFYTGSLWIMASGSWEVRFTFSGSGGVAHAAVPVPAAPLAILHMQRGLGLLLGVLGLLLTVGFVVIVGAAVREARLPPGEQPLPSRQRVARAAMVAASILIVCIVFLSNKWWDAEASDYAADVFQPAAMHSTLDGNQLRLKIDVPEPQGEGKQLALAKQRALPFDALLTDHGKVMHLYAIRWPEMDAAFHLHPDLTEPRHLSMTLPAMPPGTYRLYADIVLRNGFPETLQSTITVPDGMSSAPVASDDASAKPAPLSAGDLGASYKLPDGYTMVWDKPANLTANTAEVFHFRLLDPAGKPATDVQPYLGMAGHAAFVKTDGSVFAHTHPGGSAAMPALLIANGESPEALSASETPSAMPDMPGMRMHTAALPPEVGFPYGFPSAGRYRIFIQTKHGSTVETGVFDAEVH